MYKLELENGKYVVQHNNGANFEVYRHGELWKDLNGDGFTLALVNTVEYYEGLLDFLENMIPCLDEVIEQYEE